MKTGPDAPPQQDLAQESLAHLLGGRRAAIDATIGPVVFGVTYLAVPSHSIGWASLAALIASGLVAIWRLSRGGQGVHPAARQHREAAKGGLQGRDRPRAVLLGLLGVVVAALIALRTGQAEDFYLVRILTNVASLLAWLVSVAIRWPLLGVVVGTVLGQRSRWRHDPDLLRAYSRASAAWSLQYLIRVLVWLPLWWAGNVAALAATNLALTWPLIATALGVSWWIIRRTLPAGHPGLRHPQTQR